MLVSGAGLTPSVCTFIISKTPHCGGLEIGRDGRKSITLGSASAT